MIYCNLLQFTDFAEGEFYNDIKLMNNKAKISQTSCTKNLGIDELCEWILQEVSKKIINKQ